MKKTLLLGVVLSLIVIATGVAQDVPRFVSLFTAHTQLGHGPEYEAAVKDLWAAMKASGADFPVYAWQSVSSPGDYTFATFLGAMGDLDTQNAAFDKTLGSNPALIGALTKHSHGNTTSVLATRPDLAYVPENPRLGDDEQNFARTTRLYVYPAHGAEVEAAIKEFAALSKKKGIRDGFTVAVYAVGDGAVYNIRSLAKSEADYYVQAAKNEAALGAEAAAIRQRVGPMLRRIEYVSSVRRTDLAYLP